MQIQRHHKGRPLDYGLTRRSIKMTQTFATYFPTLSGKVGAYFLEKRMYKAYPNIDPSWNLLPAKPLLNGGILVSDDLIPLLAKGAVTSVPGIKRLAPTSPTSVEFTDGTIIDSVDAC
jgi:hypothetical protein